MTKPKVSIEKVSPERARDILANSPEKRVNGNDVAAMAKTIIGGGWHYQYFPIVLDAKGAVIDGSVRLQAIDRAGVPVECVVLVMPD